MQLTIGNAAVATFALVFSKNASSAGLAGLGASALLWLVVWDTMRPLKVAKKPTEYEHASSRRPGEDVPPPYPGESLCETTVRMI
jgi:hypothetical protein